MTHLKWLALALLLLLVFLVVATAPAAAGEKSYKCTMDTQACLDKMVTSMKNRGWVGIEMDDSKGYKAIEIRRVVPGSPAEAAGFLAGDVLVSLNGIKFADSTEDKCAPCEAMKDHWTPGTKVHYIVTRGGKEVQVEPTLAPVPTDVMAQWIGMHMMEHAQVEVAKK